MFLINSFKGVFRCFLGFLCYFYRCFSLQEAVLGCFHLCVRLHFSLALSVLYGLDCFFRGLSIFLKLLFRMFKARCRRRTVHKAVLIH